MWAMLGARVAFLWSHHNFTGPHQNAELPIPLKALLPSQPSALPLQSPALPLFQCPFPPTRLLCPQSSLAGLLVGTGASCTTILPAVRYVLAHRAALLWMLASSTLCFGGMKASP